MKRYLRQEGRNSVIQEKEEEGRNSVIQEEEGGIQGGESRMKMSSLAVVVVVVAVVAVVVATVVVTMEMTSSDRRVDESTAGTLSWQRGQERRSYW